MVPWAKLCIADPRQPDDRITYEGHRLLVSPHQGFDSALRSVA